MLTVDNVSKSYGDQVLFRNASFGIDDGERIGVIGPNGAGKTTFFRMLMGDEFPDEGEVRVPKNYRMAQLRQEWLPQPGDTVLESALREFRPWFEARESLRKLEEQLTESGDDGKHLAQYHDVEHQFTFLGGHDVEQSAK